MEAGCTRNRVRCGSGPALSDRRHKKAISPLTDSSLDQILGLSPVRFEWRTPMDIGMEGVQVGFIAQEVQRTFPSTET